MGRGYIAFVLLLIKNGETVNLRGQAALRSGKFVGQAGRDRLLQREPNHF